MLSLLIAAAGRRFPDRPLWPTLPQLQADSAGLLHAKVTCPAVTGATEPLPATTAVFDCPRRCGCVEAAVVALEADPAGGEMRAAADTLAFAADAAWWHGLLTQSWLNCDATSDAAVLRQARRKLPMTDDPVGNLDLLDQVAAGLSTSRHVLDRTRLLPEILAGPVAASARQSRDLHARAAVVLREVFTDSVIDTVSRPCLTGPAVAAGDTSWWFYPPSSPGFADTPGLLWPEHTVRVPDPGPDSTRQRVVVQVPTVFALAWLGVSGHLVGELVTADPAAAAVKHANGRHGELPQVTVVDRALIGQVTVEVAEVAARIWTPRPLDPSDEQAMPAATALSVALGIVAAGRRLPSPSEAA